MTERWKEGNITRRKKKCGYSRRGEGFVEAQAIQFDCGSAFVKAWCSERKTEREMDVVGRVVAAFTRLWVCTRDWVSRPRKTTKQRDHHKKARLSLLSVPRSLGSTSRWRGPPSSTKQHRESISDKSPGLLGTYLDLAFAARGPSLSLSLSSPQSFFKYSNDYANLKFLNENQGRNNRIKKEDIEANPV